MCNCGNKRENYSRQLSGSLVNEQVSKMNDQLFFEYTGNSGLSVKGGVTGKLYRFNFNGDKQLIDYRDAKGMQKIDLLKQKS